LSQENLSIAFLAPVLCAALVSNAIDRADLTHMDVNRAL
jgi:hypothetical protein